jgi:hypothetical protein
LWKSFVKKPCGDPVNTGATFCTFRGVPLTPSWLLATPASPRNLTVFTFLRQFGLDATNWRAELVIWFGVMLRKVWGGSRTWVGARAQSVLMSVWRTCWQQGRSALDVLSQLLRGTPGSLAMPP